MLFSIPIAGASTPAAEFKSFADAHDIRLSVGEVGVCWDNAVAESFFSTLKLHVLHGRQQLGSQLQARVRVGGVDRGG